MKKYECYICGEECEDNQGVLSHRGFVHWTHEACLIEDDRLRVAEKDAYIQELKDRGVCIFSIPYHGACENPVVPGTDFCEKHLGVKCSNPGCEEQAIAGCDATSMLVCGAPYCKKCGFHQHGYL